MIGDINVYYTCPPIDDVKVNYPNKTAFLHSLNQIPTEAQFWPQLKSLFLSLTDTL